MEALRDWIAPILIQALDEHLELTKQKSVHIEDDVSHLCIHSDSEEFVQFVEWRSTASDITAIVADKKSSIRAAFLGASCPLTARNFTTSGLPDLKPGAVIRLTCPEVRISDCFDPVRVQLWVRGFSVLQSGGICEQGAQPVEISTQPGVTERLRRFTSKKVEDIMPGIATNSAADSSPELKSQVSAEDGSDYENMGDPLGSQTNFATQVPFSPPKPLVKAPPKHQQLLGKRKVMTDLRQLVSDSSRSPKKNKLCAEGHKTVSTESNVQTDVERDGIVSPSGKSAIKNEHLLKERGISNRRGGLGRPSQHKASPQDPDAAEGDSSNCQSSPRQICKIVSESRVRPQEDHHITLAKWRDRLSNATYIPRYLQMISKAQNNLLAGDDKWQPALVGQPTRPGTLPLELLNRLTAAADRNAVVCAPVPSNQQVLELLSDVSGGEADNVERQLDLPSNSLILKTTVQAPIQSPSEAHEAESDSEVTRSECPSSSPRSPPLQQILPPDSSPLMDPKSMSERSPSAKGPSRLVMKSKDSVPSCLVQIPCIEDMPESSQRSRHHSNNPEASICTLSTTTETSSNLKEESTFELPSAAVEAATIFPPGANSLPFSNVLPTSVECATTALDPTPIINSSDDYARRMAVENNHAIHVSDTRHIPRAPTSSALQPHSHQLTESSLKTLQTQSAKQRFPQPSLLIPGTFLQSTLGSQPTTSLQDLHEPRESMKEFEVNSSENGNVHDVCGPERLADRQDLDVETSACQQAVLEIQSTSHGFSDGSGYPADANNSRAAYSDVTYSDTDMISKRRVSTASESNSLGKRARDATNEGELLTHMQPAKSKIASPVLSVSSEEPDFRRVDNMTKQYRSAVYATLRKIDTATPLPPSTLLASNASLQSESLHSSDRRHSAQTSILRHVKTSTPITGLSVQGQNVSGERRTSTSEMSRRSSLRPEDQYIVFKQNYQTYRGNFSQFLISCRMIKKLRTAGKLLPQGVWDDFVHRHHHDYRSYLDDIAQSNELERPMPYEEYYADCVAEPVYLKGTLKIHFIDALSAEIDPTTRPDTTALAQSSEVDHLHRHGYSIAASSSASNIHPREQLPDQLEEATAEDDSVTLETQLQLRQQEEAHQSQSSSVHLWLQTASGATSSELGTANILAAAGDMPCIDLTQNDEDLGFDFVRELQALQPRNMKTRKGSSGGSLEEARMPDAKMEPFKYFTLGHARLDGAQHRRSEIQSDTNGALRPAFQRIIEIFRWRS